MYIDSGSATLQGGQIISNSADYGGGAYLDQPSADLSLSRGHIVSNTATSSGGGAYIRFGTTTVSRTIISGNNAPSGGGIFKDDGTLTLVNTTLSHNVAYNGSGGGLRSDAGETSLAYLTVASNTATSGGGGIHAAGGTIHLQDTIVAYNDTANCNTGLTSDGYNLDSGDTCGLNATGDQQNTDPKLGPLADNGGPSTGSGGETLTHALLSGSPAIDGGDCIAGITTDQRGVPRPQGDTCDIGAYEYVAGGAVYLPIILRD
jgi:predicted outer membrane repeat protein